MDSSLVIDSYLRYSFRINLCLHFTRLVFEKINQLKLDIERLKKLRFSAIPRG